MRAEGDEQKPNREEGRSKESSATRWERTRANAKTILSAVLLAIFIRIVLFEAFEIEGPSMEPTLLNGDRVVVAKFLYGLFLPFTNEAMANWGMPDPGDVVIVRSPADNIDIVKRVIGVPGDVVEMRDNVVWRNGSPIPTEVLGPCQHEQYTPGPCVVAAETIGDEHYEVSRSPVPTNPSEPPTRVPPGQIYILGDHRDRSNDSRSLGTIPVDRVKGRALFIYWSSHDHVRWGRIGEGID